MRRSNANRQGLRRPSAHTSRRAVDDLAYGFELGTEYRFDPQERATSMRSTLPSRRDRFWAFPAGSPLPPPSPVPM